MLVVRDPRELPDGGGRGRYVAIGAFDGVHLGHRRLLREMVEDARREGVVGVVLTFDPHPRAVLQSHRPLRYLTTQEEKLRLMAELGVETVLLYPFTPSFARMTPESFVRQVLVGELRAARVYVGFNFTFGRDGAGTPELLGSLGAELGFDTRVYGPVRVDGEPVSSSRVRQALEAGDVRRAAALLGRPYCLEGVVQHGEARGRTIGFPTANIAVPAERCRPALGVYAVRVDVAGALWAGVANLGRRPTFGGGAELLEVHLLDFDGELYGSRARVCFEARLREERRFPDVTALQEQIRRDVQAARRALASPFGGTRPTVLE
ncbi:MAG: bifunctional riboflavin kinase/FAD synthetase [Clostridia bacterium]|nr:bifunctional riboflavin kinase/FAD synthetase [Clostridia bacterium]